jgi:hypothetical protein
VTEQTGCVVDLVDQVDADAATADCGHDRPQRLRSATGTADHLAEVVRVDPNLEYPAGSAFAQIDGHVIRVVHDAADQVVKRLFEHLLRRSF